jgi:hypothetical protein
VIDMGDDGEISNLLGIHSERLQAPDVRLPA